MTAFLFVLHVVLLSFSPQVRYSRDVCNYDGDQFVSLCVGLFQVPESWSCVEVPAASKSTRPHQTKQAASMASQPHQVSPRARDAESWLAKAPSVSGDLFSSEQR